MSTFRKMNRQGNIANALLVVFGLTIFAGMVAQLLLGRAYFVKRSIKDTQATLNVQSGIESFLLAFRTQEMRYLTALSAANCNNAKSFFEGLKSGHGCATAGGIVLFTDGSGVGGTPESGEASKVYNYWGGASPAQCTVSQNSSTCKDNLPRLMVTIGDDTFAAAPADNKSVNINELAYKIHMTAIQPDRGMVEFLVESKTKDGKTTKNAFAVKKNAGNFAHMEADGRVTQETPDPLSKCKMTAWGDLFLFNSAQKCVKFGQLAGGEGLAFYKNKYFGLRKQDGQVTSLEQTTPAPTTMFIGEDGKLGGTGSVIFPSYTKSQLVGVDDLATIGDSLYYVKGEGDQAEIGGIADDGTMKRRYCLCPLGTKGWGAANAGLVAMAYSHNIMNGAAGSATFLVKTDTGDLLTVLVSKTGNTAPSGTSWTCASAVSAGYSCVIVKDPFNQPVEYKRTYGFERMKDQKPYYLY